MSQALFPGWRPDADDRARLELLAGALREARPAQAPALQLRRPDQWHATLCFIGRDVNHLVTEPLLQSFAQVAARIPPHRFGIDRVVYWPQSGAVVALPHDCPPLQALCDATAEALRRRGIRPLQTTSQPHITLGYLDKHLPPQPWLDAVDCRREPFTVDRFELLFNPGGRYQSLHAWTLTGSGLPRAPEQGSLL